MGRHEVRIAGFGGQGVVMAGFILGKAAALYDDKDVVFSQSYGPEARGGACAAEVIIDDEAVDYPVVSHPDVVVLMSQEAAAKYTGDLSDQATIIVDQDLVNLMADREVHSAPTTRMAEDLGRRMVANIAMLGYVTAVTGLTSRNAMEEAIKTTVPPKTIELNLRAFSAGYDYATRSLS